MSRANRCLLAIMFLLLATLFVRTADIPFWQQAQVGDCIFESGRVFKIVAEGRHSFDAVDTNGQHYTTRQKTSLRVVDCFQRFDKVKE